MGWLGSATVARIGGLTVRSIPWRHAPYFGALAAIAVYVSWKLTHNGDGSERGSEREEKPDVAATDDSEFRDLDEKLDSALQEGVPDEDSELRTKIVLNSGDLVDSGTPFLDVNQGRNAAFPGSDGVSNGKFPGNQIEVLSPDVQDGEAELNKGVGEKAKYVTEDILPFGAAENVEEENHIVDNSVILLEAEPLEAVVSSSEARMPNFERPDSDEVLGNMQSTHAVQDVKELRDDPQIADTPVDKNVDTTSESAADVQNAISKDNTIFTFKTKKSNRLFPKIESNILAGHKRKVTERATRPITPAGSNFEDEVIPAQEGYKTDEGGTSGAASLSSDSRDWKSELVDAATESMEPPVQIPKHTDSGKSSFSSVPQESVNNIRTNSSTTLNSNDITESSGSRDTNCSANTSRDSASDPCQDSDDEHVVQSSSPMRHNLVESKETTGSGEGSDSGRREYAERLRSYDEYLADPELSPTMRSQVLRARASIALYFDDSDDGQ